MKEYKDLEIEILPFAEDDVITASAEEDTSALD